LVRAGGEAAERCPGVGVCRSAARLLRMTRRGAGLLGPAAQDCSRRRRPAGAGPRSPPKISAARANEHPLPPCFHGGKLKCLVGENWQTLDGVSTLDIGPQGTRCLDEGTAPNLSRIARKVSGARQASGRHGAMTNSKGGVTTAHEDATWSGAPLLDDCGSEPNTACATAAAGARRGYEARRTRRRWWLRTLPQAVLQKAPTAVQSSR
jgi:hypothetical protein